MNKLDHDGIKPITGGELEFAKEVKSGNSGLKAVFFHRDGGPSMAFLQEVVPLIPSGIQRSMRSVNTESNKDMARAELQGETNLPCLVYYRNGEQFRVHRGMPHMGSKYIPKDIAKAISAEIAVERSTND